MEKKKKEEGDEQLCGNSGHCGPSYTNLTSHHMALINITPKKGQNGL